MKNDMQIKQDVLAGLGREQNVIAGSIGVEVHHGVVKLAGRVNDSEIKKNAGLAAGAVDGVTNVVMDIDVAAAGSARSQPATSLV
jgi:osmotically-inducible protein OsmY